MLRMTQVDEASFMRDPRILRTLVHSVQEKLKYLVASSWKCTHPCQKVYMGQSLKDKKPVFIFKTTKKRVKSKLYKENRHSSYKALFRQPVFINRKIPADPRPRSNNVCGSSKLFYEIPRQASLNSIREKKNQKDKMQVTAW